LRFCEKIAITPHSLYEEVFMRVFFCLLLAGIFLPGSLALGDTFVNTQSGLSYHGYATGKEDNGLSDVNTIEKGIVKINLSQFKITRDKTGRNNTVELISIPSDIVLGMEANAFEKAVGQAASKGPLFILIEIDTPGGRVGLVMRMCSAIVKTSSSSCDVYAYVKGGSNGGAYSGGAVVALACNKIYMSPGTAIGAATIISRNSEGKPVDIRQTLGQTVGEKMSSAWRNYLASLAENSGRPAILAKAMENKDIEAIEVNENGKRVFIESVNKKPDQTIVKTWSKRDSLLTLSAQEAVDCGIADKIYNNRQDLLADHNAVSAQVICDESMAKARELCQRIEKSIKRIDASVDLGVKRLKATHSRASALRAMRGLINDAQFVLGLKKKFGEDVPVDEQNVQEFLNSVQAEYDALRTANRP
jgi:membrane-bound ClpP family serine protease